MTADRRVGRIEGYAIVSEDGMLADATGTMPASLMFEADQRFYEHGLDQAGVVVHGRHSGEHQPRSHLRRRLILTRGVPAIVPCPANDKALFWNPAGASFEDALSALDASGADVGVIGGTDVFALFLDRYDAFHLSRAPNVWLPGGRPVFPDVPVRTPEDVLLGHGLKPGPRKLLDAAQGLTLVTWHRAA